MSFEQVRAACLLHIRSLAPQVIPGGRWNGDWYWCRVPWRDDGRASLAISATTGRWRDWGYEDPDNGSTLIDLVARLDSCTTAQAKDKLAGLLGLSAPVAGHEVVQRKKPHCSQCRHVWERFGDELALRWDYLGPPDTAVAPFRRYCMAALDVLGEPRPTEYVRQPGAVCGTWGKLWQPFPVQNAVG